jgi:hypothetical protein
VLRLRLTRRSTLRRYLTSRWIPVIKLQCVCGHLLTLPDELAGKQVRCKRCNKVLKVRAASDEGAVTASGRRKVDSALTVQGTRPCPGCAKPYPPAIVVCTDCGLNIDSGAMLYASLDADAAPSAGPEAVTRKPAGLWQRVLRGLGFGRKG